MGSVEETWLWFDERGEVDPVAAVDWVPEVEVGGLNREPTVFINCGLLKMSAIFVGGGTEVELALLG